MAGQAKIDTGGHGPEYISATLLNWAETQGITLNHIQPGKPQQNAYVERYNRTVRHEWLDLYIFDTIQEMQDIATSWLWPYPTWALAACRLPKS